MIRWLTGLVAVAALLWSGWWLVGSAWVLRGVTAGVEDLRAQGWEIAYDDLSVAGFPNRFDTNVDAPQVTAPDGATGWSAPFLQVFALTYRPTHLIAVAPHEMMFFGPRGQVQVTSDDLRGSVVGSALTDPVLVRATVTGERVAVSGDGFDVALEAAQVATRQAGSEAVHDVALTLSGMTLGTNLRALLDPGQVLPPVIGTVSADTQITLTEAVGAGRSPLIAGVTVRNAALAWGDVRLDINGDVVVGVGGVPEGTLTLRAEGWRQVLRLAVGLGLLDEARLPLIAAGVGAMADGDGAVTLDLVLAGGQMSLAGIPLGPVPGL